MLRVNRPSGWWFEPFVLQLTTQEDWEDEDDESDPQKQLENKLLSDLLSQFAPAADYGFDTVDDEDDDPDAANDPINQIELQVSVHHRLEY